MIKSKFYIIAFLFLILGKECYSQTFSKTYILDTDSFVTIVFNGLSIDTSNNMVCSFVYIDQNSPYYGSGLAKMDSGGNLINYSSLTLDGREGVLCSKYFDETNHYLVSTYGDTSVFSFSKYDEYLVLVYSQFIDYQNYGIEFQPSFLHKIDTNKFSIGGIIRTSNYVNKNKAIIFIVDSLGAIQRTVSYNTSKWSDSFRDIYIDEMYSRVWVSGVSFDEYTQDNVTYGVPFVIEYDTNWNKLSMHRFEDSLQITGTFKFQFTDTSYYLASGFGVESYPGLHDYQKPRLLESNLNGNVIWNYNDTTGVRDSYSVFVDVKIDDVGSIYGLAYSFSETDLDSILNYPGTSDWDVMQQALLFKWNSKKEIQWVRHIRHDNAQSFNSINLPRNLEVLEDHSIVFSGYYAPGLFDTGLYKAQGWLVKTDSNGCISGRLCKDWKITGVKELPKKLKGVPFVVFPNPSQNGILYSKTIFSINNKAYFYTLNGELVCNSSFKNNQLAVCNNLSNGYYILKVFDKNKYYVTIINVVQ